MKKPELLAPAGNLEKLKIAFAYGADAVYLGGENYGLRAMAGNFSPRQMEYGVYLAHEAGKKVYVTINILMRDNDLTGLPEYLKRLGNIGIDGFIISDLGALACAMQYASQVPVTLSTQASVMNSAAASVYRSLGVERIVAARELSLDEIANIKRVSGIEIEAFVHGAMCISYSGRCLLSSYMTGRSGNRGECAHPCRYQYTLHGRLPGLDLDTADARIIDQRPNPTMEYTLVEELRPEEYFPIEEDERGTYIMNSKDLCLWDEVPALMAAGIDAFKIEGRMKSLHYVATVTRAYREAIDAVAEGREPDLEFWQAELGKVATRPYTKGFIYGTPEDAARDFVKQTIRADATYCGLVVGYERHYQRMLVEERAPFRVGDDLEIFTPTGLLFSFKLEELYGADRLPLERAKHARELVWIPYTEPIPINSLLRKKN